MNSTSHILTALEKCHFKVSTDSRKDLSGSVYFALKGDNFDGNIFVEDAIKKGALFAVSDNPKNVGKNVFIVNNVLETLHQVAKEYRKTFNIPIIGIGGSNGKTTSKELLRDILKTKYIVHSTEGSFNNHFGVPLSILAMKKEVEIAVFEIGANHPFEHTKLLNIISPTHVVVTNNGMDHLEGFLSPKGARRANKEIYDWTFKNNAVAFVDKKKEDLTQDSKKNQRIFYSDNNLKIISGNPLIIALKKKKYKTKLAGDYNIDNIALAISVGKYFGIDDNHSMKSICKYQPKSKRSQLLKIGKNNFIVDCYNANPSSMELSIKSFLKSSKNHNCLILGDMLELEKYSDNEHQKILKYIKNKSVDEIVLVGESFGKALKKVKIKCQWFENSDIAREWFKKQNFKKYTFLLKGSRGVKVEKIIGL